jgi:hypothetical protein
MGNSHCVVRNDTNTVQVVRVYNYHDWLYWSPRGEYEIPRNSEKQVEALSCLEGLKLIVRDQPRSTLFYAANGDTVNVSAFLPQSTSNNINEKELKEDSWLETAKDALYVIFAVLRRVFLK